MKGAEMALLDTQQLGLSRVSLLSVAGVVTCASRNLFPPPLFDPSRSQN
jgi:hypothetical protein